MKRKIYSITLLLSFMAVLGHLMVPHHHHESSKAENSSKHIHQTTHSHYHSGTHHHHHESEESENEKENNAEPGFPQHFHFSVTNDFDFLRLNKVLSNDVTLGNQDLITSQLFFWELVEPPIIILNSNFELEKHFFTQNKPGANGLRGPPSIA